MSVSRWLSGLSSDSVPRWAVYGGVAAGALLLSGGVVWYCQPAAVTNIKMKLALQKSGFSVRCVQGSVHRYCYAERGSLRSDQPSLVFVGGFSGCKEDWLLLAQAVQSDFHVVLLDLPGQGQASVPSEPSEASLYAYVDMLAEFLTLTDISVIPAHLVGISMGASLAALYTAKHAQSVCRLTLICPAVQCPIETEAWQEVAYGTDTATGKSALVNLNDSAFFNTERIPNTIWKYRSQQRSNKSKQNFYKHMRAQQFAEITEESKKFEERLSEIRTPTQIIWGEEDQILHVSGASMLEEVVPGVKRVDILDSCGHAVHLERPDQARGLIMDFYNTTYSS